MKATNENIDKEHICCAISNNNDIQALITAEKSILAKIQKDDGGFDISWQWRTPYPEFEQARQWWRPRTTIDKMLFWQNY